MIVEYSEIDHKKLIEWNYKQDMWNKNGMHPQLNSNRIRRKSFNHVRANDYNMPVKVSKSLLSKKFCMQIC